MATVEIHVDTYVEVDVDLSRFDTSDLMEEITKRDIAKHDHHAKGVDPIPCIVPPLNSEEVHPLHRVYYRLKLGDESGALEEMRTFLQDELGVVL